MLVGGVALVFHFLVPSCLPPSSFRNVFPLFMDHSDSVCPSSFFLCPLPHWLLIVWCLAACILLWLESSMRYIVWLAPTYMRNTRDRSITLKLPKIDEFRPNLRSHSWSAFVYCMWPKPRENPPPPPNPPPNPPLNPPSPRPPFFFPLPLAQKPHLFRNLPEQ